MSVLMDICLIVEHTGWGWLGGRGLGAACADVDLLGDTGVLAAIVSFGAISACNLVLLGTLPISMALRLGGRRGCGGSSRCSL